jgi:hypothetical protein
MPIDIAKIRAFDTIVGVRKGTVPFFASPAQWYH